MDFSVCCSFSWLLMTCIETSCCMKAGNQSSISRFEQQPQKTQICTSHRRVKVRLRLHVIPTPCSFMWDDKLWFLCLSSYSEASRFVWSLQRHSRNTCYPPFVSNNAAAGWSVMGRRGAAPTSHGGSGWWNPQKQTRDCDSVRTFVKLLKVTLCVCHRGWTSLISVRLKHKEKLSADGAKSFLLTRDVLKREVIDHNS